MRSSLLLTPTTTRKLRDLKHMAAYSDSQQLTFYEDLYLKPHKKSTSMPCRRTVQPSGQAVTRSKRQSSMTESHSRRSSSQSPVNNPLLDSPPSARSLTLAANSGPVDAPPKLTSPNEDGNNNDYLQLAAPIISSKDNIYENHPFFPSQRAHKEQTQNGSNTYEVIPDQGLASPMHSNYNHKIKCLTDESNYIVTPKAQTRDPSKWSKTDNAWKLEETSTNLRVMRRIGRSADSIRSLQGNKLRSQSTILAPQLWIKSSTKEGRIGNSMSCDNITGDEAEFRRLSRDKENNNPYTPKSKHHTGERRPRWESSSRSLRHRQSEESMSDSLKNSSSSLSNWTTSVKGNPRNHHHRHSSSYSGPTASSTYENMALIHKAIHRQQSAQTQRRQDSPDYVNIPVKCSPHKADLNYADLDFPLPKYQDKQKTGLSGRGCRSTTPSGLNRTSVTEESEDSVVYSQINIAATQAARLACAEHQQYRQRDPHAARPAT